MILSALLAAAIAQVVAPPAPPATVVVAPPPSAIRSALSSRSANPNAPPPATYFIQVDVEGGGDHLWSGELAVGATNSAVTLTGLRDETNRTCPPPFSYASARLEISATSLRSQSADALQFNLVWVRVEPRTCPTGTRQVEVHQAIELPITGPIEVKGDAGLVARIRKR